jgi:DNA-binding FrmR family transcriptional regulator
MTDEVTVLQRLRSAQGHLDAVVRMAEEGSHCLDVVHQLSAVQGALERVRRRLVEEHLRECVPEALATGRLADVIDELVTAVFGGPPRQKVME